MEPHRFATDSTWKDLCNKREVAKQRLIDAMKANGDMTGERCLEEQEALIQAARKVEERERVLSLPGWGT